MLEPYEGKLSRTVLRGGRSGNAPLPLGAVIGRKAMGRWAEVHCGCPNRCPLPTSGWQCEPHRKRRRLTAKQREERRLWEQTTKDMYECGHRNGCLLEFWPGYIIQFGRLINSAFPETRHDFPIFARVADRRSYHELLLLPTDQARLWLSETDSIWRILEEGGTGPNDALEPLLTAIHDEDSELRLSLEKRLSEIRIHLPFTRVNPFIESVRKSDKPDLQSAVDKVVEALEDARRLCLASIESGNPIRLLW